MAYFRMFLNMLYALLARLAPRQNEQNLEQHDQGHASFVVRVNPYMGEVPEILPPNLIPINYTVVRRVNHNSANGGEDEHELEPEHEWQQQHELPRPRDPEARPVVLERHQIRFLNNVTNMVRLTILALILNQQGPWERIITLFLFALFVCLYRARIIPPFPWFAREWAPPGRWHAPVRENDPPVEPNDDDAPSEEPKVQENSLAEEMKKLPKVRTSILREEEEKCTTMNEHEVVIACPQPRRLVVRSVSNHQLFLSEVVVRI
ncbi:hypothetical protein J5N97_021571 [Dioscorea zingiberensis]|uniref:Uncharacterized protein n=1 Tax=Dioscorea zingiberensis TaxID=325984 RepID=A0A9D5C942_9LILI|nr:hypothetical protein J5N97_021571 [Dioscorea zingiberensis]